MLQDTGYKKPIERLTLADKISVKAVLIDYHCMIKVKACMDQFAEGLQELQTLEIMKKYPELMKPLFVFNEEVITAGNNFLVSK